MYKVPFFCPAPGCYTKIPTNNPQDADYVVNGIAVCSEGCKHEMFDYEHPVLDLRFPEPQLQFYHPIGPP